jgi:uncharacterized protein YdaU (DUF1376 family)
MPLYVADYLAATAHLSARQSGAYLHLIMHYWQKGKLPTDEKFLARIAKLTDREWATERPILAEFFGSDWSQKRVASELKKFEQKAEARADAGKRGGIANALKNQEARLANATPLLEHLLQQNGGNGSDKTGSKTIPSSSSSSLREDLAAQHLTPAALRDDQFPEPEPEAIELDRITVACNRALGDKAITDVVIGPIHALIRDGIPLARILDVLRSEARRPRQKPIRSWRMWATIIVENRDSPAAKVNGNDSYLASIADKPKVTLDHGIGAIPTENILRALRDPKGSANWIEHFFTTEERFRQNVALRAPQLLEQIAAEGTPH